MTSVSIGDMARIFQSRQLTSGLKADLSRLGKELATGIRSDISDVVAGDYGPIANIERLLTTLSARKNVTAEASVIANNMQNALDAIQEHGRETSTTLLSVQSNQSSATQQITANNARERLDSIVAALNTHAGGRTLFGGAATDHAALASADDMMAAITVAIAAETTAAGVESVVDAWFDTPAGGFETVGYLGSNDALGPFQTGDGEQVALDFRADNSAIREVLKSFAMASIVAEGSFTGTAQEQSALLNIAGQRMINADQDLTTLRADIGMSQERIETADVRNSAKKTALEIARNDLISADPYDTASRLEAAYTQLETYYTVTARLSRLKFTDFMR